MPRTRCLLLFVLMGTLAEFAAAEDWPRWRGPRGDGTWKAPALPDKFPEGGLRHVWKQPIGGGYAGIAVADGRLFTIDHEKVVPAPKAPEPDGHERVLCLSTEDGKPVWSHKYPTRYGGLGGYNNGPRAMPTVHDGRVYTLGAVGHLFCFEAATGKVLWEKDLVKDFKATIPQWGLAGSPVMEGDRVIVQAGAAEDGCLIAFDRKNGKEVWRSLADPAGYATPIAIDTKGGRQVVLWTPENVRGVDPENGKLLWTVPYKVTYGVAIATPIFQEDILFVSGYWEGSKAIRLGPKPADAKVVWEDRKELRGLMAQPLYRQGHVYSIDKGNGLTCFELATGKKLWDDGNKLTPRGRNPHASIVWLGDSDRVLAINAVGELVHARLTPKGYEEVGRTRAIEGKVWGHPAFAGKHIYVRNDGAEQSVSSGPFELVCLELPKP